jgi:hypothetical protein
VGNNVIDFRKKKLIRDIQKNRYLRIKSVDADPLTGDWITEPGFTGQMVSEVYWKNQEDTSEQCHQIMKLDDGIEYALLINWIRRT